MALSKQYRLSNKLEIEKVFKRGRVINFPFFFIRFKLNNLSFSRFTIIVGSKISKKAVIRNKIKRRLRELLRFNIIGKITGYDLVISAKSGIINQSCAELKESLISGLGKIK